MSRILNGFSQENIEAAAGILMAGGLVAFPTETVYGLGADARSDIAVAKIFAAKGRPSFNPLIIHFADVKSLKQQVEFNAAAQKLAAAFWPGPFTMVLKRSSGCSISKLASAGLDTIAVRMPASEIAKNLIKAAGFPLAAPSANTSGRISPTMAEHVAASLGENVQLILDGGACSVGVESTVLDVSADVPILLRPGTVTKEQIENVLGQNIRLLSEIAQPEMKSPGMLQSHYAPDIPVRLNATTVTATEALIAFGGNAPKGAKKTLNLSENGDFIEAAANLFKTLHELNMPEFSAIAVAEIPSEGLGVAINDRLKRAAG